MTGPASHEPASHESASHEQVDQVAEAIAAELETLSPECRADPARLDAFLADDFHEYGASGREIVKQGTADRVAACTDVTQPPIEVEAMRGQLLADGVVMVKYTATGPVRRAHRTSIWRREGDGRWQMVHHQGTPVPGDPGTDQPASSY